MLRFFSKNLSDKAQKSIKNHTKIGSATLRKRCCQTCFKNLEFLQKIAPKIDLDPKTEKSRKNRFQIASRPSSEPKTSQNLFRIDFWSILDLPGSLHGRSWGAIFNIFEVIKARCILTKRDVYWHRFFIDFWSFLTWKSPNPKTNTTKKERKQKWR